MADTETHAHRRPQPPQRTAGQSRPSQPKRLAAALGVVFVFAAVLVTVPLVSPDPAEAHDIYYWTDQKQQRCAYDPIAGQQCWTVTVRVRVPSHHSHAQVCPTGTTGTYPDCNPILPTPVVPTTPAIPDLNEPKEPEPEPETTQPPPPPTTKAPPPPTTTTTEPPKCPPGQTGTPPNCKIPPPPCAWPKHTHGSTCHGPHVPPCGTGTWSPGHGHTAVQRPPCPTEVPKTTEPKTTQPDTTEPPDCKAGEHRHTLGARRNRGGGTTSNCHDASASHCAGNMHEHVHGSQECHTVDPGGGSGWSSHHCPDGQHQHEHAASPCHSLSIAHCDGEGDHAHELTTPSGYSMSHWCHPEATPHCGANEHYHDGLGCHSISADKCPAGQHEHVLSLSLSCHDPSIVHHSSGPLQSAIGLLELGICGPLHLVQNWTGPVLVEGCKEIHDQLRKDAQERADKKNQEHDDEKKPTTTEGPPPPTTAPTPTTEPPLSDAEARRLLDQIERDFRARKINANEANEAHNRIRCRQGHWSCRQ